MTLFAFQIAVLFLVLLSFLMVVAVPVVAASPNGWNENKNLLVFGSAFWLFLVVVIGALNYSVI